MAMSYRMEMNENNMYEPIMNGAEKSMFILWFWNLNYSAFQECAIGM